MDFETHIQLFLKEKRSRNIYKASSNQAPVTNKTHGK